VTAYLRRLAPKALMLFCVGLVAVIAPQPGRIGLLFSGTVDWWRLAAFAATVLLLSFAVAAMLDWGERRKRRNSPRK
jgi:uncharacterized membrane-anchored protein